MQIYSDNKCSDTYLLFTTFQILSHFDIFFWCIGFVVHLDMGYGSFSLLNLGWKILFWLKKEDEQVGYGVSLNGAISK